MTGSERHPARRADLEAPETAIRAETLGAELAASVLQRAAAAHPAVQAFASQLNLDRARVERELAYLSIFTMQFCIDVAVEEAARPRVLRAFGEALWAAPWCATGVGVRERAPRYTHALRTPHPELGRGYWIGRAFAYLCGAAHDVSAIEFGARAYVGQLQSILAFLGSVRAE